MPKLTEFQKMQLILQLKSYKLQLIAMHPNASEWEINKQMCADDQVKGIIDACGVMHV